MKIIRESIGENEMVVVNPASKEAFIGVILNDDGLVTAYLSRETGGLPAGPLEFEPGNKIIQLRDGTTFYATLCPKPETLITLLTDCAESIKITETLNDPDEKPKRFDPMVINALEQYTHLKRVIRAQHDNNLLRQ